MLDQTPINDRLTDIDIRLAELDTRYAAWNRELERMRDDLVSGGMDFWESLDAVHRHSNESIKSGSCPIDFHALNELLDELCGVYLEASPRQRAAIRGFFDHKESALKYLHSYIGRASRFLKSSGDKKWLRLGLAAASIVDRRVDWRDLMICLGDLYLTARDAGIGRPGYYFTAVAKMSNPVGRHRESSTLELLRDFRKSAYLTSLKKPNPTTKAPRH